MEIIVIDAVPGVDGIDINKLEQIKLLGVHIDDNLNFTEHISELWTKTRQKVGVVSRLRNLIPCKAKLLPCKTIPSPHLAYGIFEVVG